MWDVELTDEDIARAKKRTARYRRSGKRSHLSRKKMVVARGTLGAVTFACRGCGSVREKDNGVAPVVCAACGVSDFRVVVKLNNKEIRNEKK